MLKRASLLTTDQQLKLLDVEHGAPTLVARRASVPLLLDNCNAARFMANGFFPASETVSAFDPDMHGIECSLERTNRPMHRLVSSTPETESASPSGRRAGPEGLVQQDGQPRREMIPGERSGFAAAVRPRRHSRLVCGWRDQSNRLAVRSPTGRQRSGLRMALYPGRIPLALARDNRTNATTVLRLVGWFGRACPDSQVIYACSDNTGYQLGRTPNRSRMAGLPYPASISAIPRTASQSVRTAIGRHAPPCGAQTLPNGFPPVADAVRASFKETLLQERITDTVTDSFRLITRQQLRMTG